MYDFYRSKQARKLAAKSKSLKLIGQLLSMQILEIKVLKGPNYWSVRRPKLIQMKLDLEEMEQRPTNEIPGFKERLEKLIPTLYEHHCSEDAPGGFFHRVEEGTWMGHVIEHVALEIQT